MTTFRSALGALDAGYHVARAGWNGKGMWIARVSRVRFYLNEPMRSFRPSDSVFASTAAVELEPFIVMKTADGKFVPWTASQTDIQANDWEIAE